MAGHVMNFFRGVRHAKQLIAEGKIGKLLYCHSARNGWEEPQPSISWKKLRSKSGGHLYHHIHEVDCIQFLMGHATEVTMTGGNVAHQGERFGDEDDMLFLLMEFGNNTYAVVEYGSAFHYPEHYVLIQGTKGYIRLDMCNAGMTVKTVDGPEEHFLLHENQAEDDQRTYIYHSTEMDGAIQYGRPGKKPPLWLHGIMKNEMKFFNGIMHGDPVTDEFRPLLTGRGGPGRHRHRRCGDPLPAGGPEGQGLRNHRLLPVAGARRPRVRPFVRRESSACSVVRALFSRYRALHRAPSPGRDHSAGGRRRLPLSVSHPMAQRRDGREKDRFFL